MGQVFTVVITAISDHTIIRTRTEVSVRDTWECASSTNTGADVYGV